MDMGWRMYMKIVILERNSVGLDISMEGFSRFGEVITYPNTVTEEEVIERIEDADVVVGNKAPLTEKTLQGAKNVKLICEFATGYDNVDLAYCSKHGIKVANVRNYSTDAVAQHTFALCLYVLEKLRHFDESFFELAGKTWGIIGMGNIGRKVAQIASAFGCRVIFHSVTGKSTCTDYEQVDFDTLLRESDVLSLHCPLSDLTRNLINKDALAKMKKSAILINVARGPVVNDQDLHDALVNGEIQAAGLDVTSTEPMKVSNPLSKIMDSRKLFITPHLAWASVEARNRCVSETCRNIEAFIKGESRNIVNE